MSGVGLVCDRGIPARAAIRVVPGLIIAVAVKRRFRPWARGLGFAVLRTGRDGTGWLRTSPSAFALPRRRGADPRARRALRPVAALLGGRTGTGRAAMARDFGCGTLSEHVARIDGRRAGGAAGGVRAMLGAFRVGRSLGRLGGTTGAARPRPRASPRKLEECYLVDPASSHMLVSKIKPCMCKYEQIQTVKLRMAH